MTAVDTAISSQFQDRQSRNFLVRAASVSKRFVQRKPLGAFGAFMLVLILTVAIFSPLIARDGLRESHVGDQLQGPSLPSFNFGWPLLTLGENEYLLGTDSIGQDLYSRVVYGSQIAALVGVGTVMLVGFISITVGMTSGYFGGKTDFIIQRFVDVWLSFPAIFLILTLVAVLQTAGNFGFLGFGRGPEIGPQPDGGPWFWHTYARTTIVVVVLGVVLAGGASRIVRAAVLGVKGIPYIDAAVVIGSSSPRILFRHILPNIMPTVIVLASVQLGAAIIIEATLSFLGVGVTNFPTWGQMLSGQTRTLMQQHMYLGLVPGIAIFLAVFGFNMLGDALRDVLDPRLRGAGGGGLG